MTAPSAHEFDVRQIPFSRRGSWLDISPVVGLHTIREELHLVTHQTGMNAIFSFTVGDGSGGTRISATPSTLNRGGDLQPITMGIYRYIGNNTQDWNAIMATAVVASIPAAVLLIVAQRYVAAGVTAGAVKD